METLDNIESIKNCHLKYIKDVLVSVIISQFKNEKFKDVKIEFSGGLDGFMSALYNITLKTTLNEQISKTKERNIIVKFMKGDNEFRESSKSYIQFANEVFIYSNVLPAYDDLLKQAKCTDISVEDWVAHCYIARFGFIEGLSKQPSTRECVLALENLKPRGYKMGPRLFLSRDHLLLMAKTIGQYHSMSYALRHHNEAKFEELRKQILPLPFVSDQKNNFYVILYRVAFDRFYEYFDRLEGQGTFDKNNPDDVKFVENVRCLREKYFEQPTMLLEYLRTSIERNEDDKRFGVIQHGDYNRNNVMFRYATQEETNSNEGKVEDIKLIDFQEVRYGTPAMDISFFMYFNTPEELRSKIWMEILKVYHDNMYNTLKKTLCGLKGENTETEISKILEQYSFEKFYAHFSRFAFYGVAICLHFLPWCLSSEEECSQLSHYFETDMHSEEFLKISLSAGGDHVNKCILNVVRHASKMGYMDNL